MNQSHPKTGFDPRACGARCDICPLGPNSEARVIPELLVDEDGRARTEWAPVRSHGVERGTLLLGEIPDSVETESGLPFDGASGFYLNRVLELSGTHRRNVGVGNVQCCAGPGASSGAFERQRAILTRVNRARKKAKLPPVPDPVECCRPRLEAELAQTNELVLLGTTALKAVLSGTSEGGSVGVGGGLTISNKRGAVGEVELSFESSLAQGSASSGASEGVRGVSRAQLGTRLTRRIKYGATYHPAFVLRKRGEQKNFERDIAKFFRFFRGKMNWTEPALLMHPAEARIHAWFDDLEELAATTPAEVMLYDPSMALCSDTETTGIEPLVAMLRCIGFGRFKTCKVERCICESHWSPRLDAMRREWLRIDKRFKDGACPVCGRATLDADSDEPLSLSLLEMLGGVEAEGELESVGALSLAGACAGDMLAEMRAGDRLGGDCEGVADGAGEDLYAQTGEAGRVSDYEVLMLFTPHSAPWLYPGGESDPAWARIKARVERVMADKRILKVGHAFGSYDRQILEPSPWVGWKVDAETRTWVRGREQTRWIEVTPEPVEDTLYLARAASPDTPKGLGDVVPTRLDVRFWKEDHAGNKVALSKNLWELGVYCGTDICTNGKVYPLLAAEARANGFYHSYLPSVTTLLALPGEVYREQAPRPDLPAERKLIKFGKDKPKGDEPPGISPREVDHRTQSMTVGMHRVGLYIRENQRRLLAEILRRQGDAHLREFAKIADSYGVKIDLEAAQVDPDEELQQMPQRSRELDESAEDGGDGETSEGGLNLRSADQLRTLFFEKMKIPRPEFLEDKEFFTKTGAWGTGDPVLRAFLADSRNPPQVKEAIRHLRAGKRKRFKLCELLEAVGRPLGSKPRGYLWPDRCVRPHTSSHSIEVWRLAMSNPNLAQIGSRKGGVLQDLGRLDELLKGADNDARSFVLSEIGRGMKTTRTCAGPSREDPLRECGTEMPLSAKACPKCGSELYRDIARGKLKSVFGSYPGHLLVGGDMDQLHLRIIANLYKIPILLEAFLNNEDPHTTLAEVLFGTQFTGDPAWARVGGYSRKKKPPGGCQASILREVAKTFRYACIYWAHPDTVWRVVVSGENELGALVNAHFTKDQIRKFHAAWRAAEPQWESYFWDRVRAQHRDHDGRVQSPLSWHYSHMMAPSDKSLIVNWPVLRMEADIARIAEVRMMQRFPFGGRDAISAQSFGGLPGQLLGLLGKYSPREVLREGMCIHAHDFMASQIRDLTGSRGVRKRLDPKSGRELEVDAWQEDILVEARDALTFSIPGHPVQYTCEPGLSYRLDEV